MSSQNITRDVTWNRILWALLLRVTTNMAEHELSLVLCTQKLSQVWSETLQKTSLQRFLISDFGSRQDSFFSNFSKFIYGTDNKIIENFCSSIQWSTAVRPCPSKTKLILGGQRSFFKHCDKFKNFFVWQYSKQGVFRFNAVGTWRSFPMDCFLYMRQFCGYWHVSELLRFFALEPTKCW